MTRREGWTVLASALFMLLAAIALLIQMIALFRASQAPAPLITPTSRPVPFGIV